MNLPQCEREPAVLAAVQSDRWSDGLRAHAESCEACSEVLLTALYLRDQAAEAATQAPLPESGRIWWQAQLRARQEAARRATRPIAFVEQVSLALGAAGLITAAVWLWPDIADRLGILKLAWGQFTALGLTPQPGFLLVASGSLLLFLLILGVYAVWAEE